MSNSQRLDSISRPLSGGGSSLGNGSSIGTSGSSTGTTGTKPSLKFKPKVISRKTKEEREANSLVHAPGEAPVKHNSLKNKARLGSKNAKMRNNQSGTTVISSGPLAAGAVSLGSNNSISRNALAGSRGSSGGHSAAFLNKLRSKNTRSMNSTADDDSDDDFVVDESISAKINMGASTNWLEEEGELLPVRAARTKHLEYGEVSLPTPDTSVKTEFHRETSVIPSGAPSREGSMEPEDANDNIDLAALVPESSETVSSLNVFQDEQENDRLKQDYLSITKFINDFGLNQPDVDMDVPPAATTDSTGSSSSTATTEIPTTSTITDNRVEQAGSLQPLVFVQLPEVLPKFVKPKSVVKLENPNSIYTAQDQENNLSGIIGKLRYHKSGKITMKLGDNVILDVTRGGSSAFIQDVISIDHGEKKCVHLGTIKEKIIATPNLD